MTVSGRRSFLHAVAGVGFWVMTDKPRPAEAQAPPAWDPSQPLPADLPVPVEVAQGPR